MKRALTGKGKKKNRWLEVTVSPRKERAWGGAKAKSLMTGDEYTTMLIYFLTAGYYSMREVLLVFDCLGG